MSPETELERWYDAHAAALHGFVLNLLRNQADARDILQEVLLKLARNPGLMTGVRDERRFLLRLAHNAAMDLIRRRGARSRLHETGEPPFAPAESPDEQAYRAALSDALAELPPEQRAVIHLKLWEGLTFDAIADLLEIPLNTAASRYRYGIDKLRARLRPIYEELR